MISTARRPALWTALLASSVVACSSTPAATKPPAAEVKIGAPPVTTATAAADSPPAPDPDADPVMPELGKWKRPDRDTDTAACKKIEAAQQAASKKDASVPEGADSDGFMPFPCMPVRGGAWGLVGTISDYERTPPISTCTAFCGTEDCGPCHLNPTVDFVPIFVTDAGAVTRGTKVSETFFGAGSGGSGEGRIGTFDLDGDGTEELIAALGKGVVLSLKDGKISTYSKFKDTAFQRIVDFDQDGRPDLLLSHPYIGGETLYGCGLRMGMGIPNVGADLEIVARSLADGTFSTDDPAAQAITKQQCPGIPRHIVAKGADGSFDNPRTWQRVACARLWGVSADSVQKALDKDCTWAADDDNCEAHFDIRDGQDVKVCASKDILSSWAKAPAPVTLK
ncbi:MAG: VCBS repeat-containing protein [Polyangiaceae bacterium]